MGQAAAENVGGANQIILLGVGHGAQGQNGQNALQKHAAVGNGLGVSLLVQLLGGGAGGDQGVEARAGVGIGDHEGVDGGHAAHVGAGQNHAHHGQSQHGVQQEGAQVVTGLQQNPHRGDGGNGDVHAADPHPGVLAQIDGVEVHADGDDGHNGDDAHNAGNAHGGVPAVHQEAEDNGDGDEQQRHHGHPGVGLRGGKIHRTALLKGGAEGAGHDGGEGRHHQDQRQVGEDQKQHLGPLAHVGGDDLADGLAVVADGGKQGAEVMDAAEEDAADENPQRAGQPAEPGGADGAGDGAGARDGREVVAHQDGGLGGDIVNAVLQGMGGGGLVIFADAPLLAQPAAIEDIAADQHSNADDQK